VARQTWRPTGAGVGLIVLASLVGTTVGVAGGVVVGAKVYGGDRESAQFNTPATAVEAKAGPDPVPGSSRLVPIGPVTVLDSRSTTAVRPGGDVNLRLPELPPSTSAVALNVSVIDAAGPGAVTISSTAGRVTVLRAPKAKVMTSATAVVAIGADNALRVNSEGGGHLLVNLVGAFELANSSTSGRVVALPPVRVLRLVPETDGKDAVIDLEKSEGLRGIGTVSAVLLRVAADVGPNGGFVVVGGTSKQVVFWAATAGADRTRAGWMIVPVAEGTINLHYEAGNVLTADVVGYVTDGTAPNATEGLVVPVGGATARTLAIGPGGQADVELLPAAGAEGVPADRVAAALLTVAATGDEAGAITVHAPDTPAGEPLLTAPRGATRQATAVVRTNAGTVRIQSAAGASINLAVQALVLSR
jgi:hypothetical protein